MTTTTTTTTTTAAEDQSGYKQTTTYRYNNRLSANLALQFNSLRAVPKGKPAWACLVVVVVAAIYLESDKYVYMLCKVN